MGVLNFVLCVDIAVNLDTFMTEGPGGSMS
jgi:hypothetical protein